MEKQQIYFNCKTQQKKGRNVPFLYFFEYNSLNKTSSITRSRLFLGLLCCI